MLFPTFEFLIFFAVVLTLNWLLKKWPLAWRLFLFLSSYFFYAVWSVNFLLALVFITLFNFYNAKAISNNLAQRKKLLFGGVLVNLLVLGYFKYYDFFQFPAQLLLQKIGLSADFFLLNIILPLGLSFYIFRAISYSADVYLNKIKPTSSLLDFSIYIAFFPQLLSGPIMRAGNFLPQLKNGGAKKIDKLYEYLSLFLLGLFKKLVIVSYLTSNIIDNTFAVPENHAFTTILLAVFAYSIVIYLDFSSYSDMAIAVAGFMGFRSPINFNLPYLALNISDFWRRWHISLSTWVRDYIYFPLGGSRKGKIREYTNLIIVMIIIGLWHGAAIHFVIWGTIHGLFLAGTHAYQKRKNTNSLSQSKKQIKKWKIIIKNFLAWIITFSFISFAWIFFRSSTTEDAFQLINNLFFPEKFTEPLKLYVIIFIILGFLLLVFEKQIMKGLINIQQKMSLIPLTVFVILVIILIFEFSPDIVPTFIYFSF